MSALLQKGMVLWKPMEGVISGGRPLQVALPGAASTRNRRRPTGALVLERFLRPRPFHAVATYDRPDAVPESPGFAGLFGSALTCGSCSLYSSDR